MTLIYLRRLSGFSSVLISHETPYPRFGYQMAVRLRRLYVLVPLVGISTVTLQAEHRIESNNLAAHATIYVYCVEYSADVRA